MKGIIGRKMGMTSIFEAGKNIPCTVLEVGPCTVTQIKTETADGYSAVQLGFGDQKEKNTTKPMKGHFSKAGVEAKQKLVEFRDYEVEVNLGDSVNAEIFTEGDIVNVVGRSKGKGFQGVVKRHGFGGVGMATHGQHNRLRAPGAIGACSTPSRVFKGTRMGGRMGGERVTTQNLRVLKVLADKNILLVSGAVPGPKGGFVLVEA